MVYLLTKVRIVGRVETEEWTITIKRKGVRWELAKDSADVIDELLATIRKGGKRKRKSVLRYLELHG